MIAMPKSYLPFWNPHTKNRSSTRLAGALPWDVLQAVAPEPGRREGFCHARAHSEAVLTAVRPGDRVPGRLKGNQRSKNPNRTPKTIREPRGWLSVRLGLGHLRIS